MTAILALAVVGALGLGLRAVLLAGAAERRSSPYEETITGDEGTPLRIAALSRIESLLRELPEEDAERELIDLVGDREALRRALR